MENNKKEIVEAALQYVNYITENIPQTDENGKCRYYFSGSLEMLLLNAAKTIKPTCLSTGGEVEREQSPISLSDKNKELLSRGVRQLSSDVDVVTVQEGTFSDKGPICEMKNVLEKCDKATVLCPKWAGGASVGYYFDCLEGDRDFTSYDVAELEMQDGSKIFVTDPLVLTVHKFADGLQAIKSIAIAGKHGRPDRVKHFEEKYQKDIRDFISLFNGIVSAYSDVDFAKLVEHVFESCPDSALSKVMYSDSSDRIKQLAYDSSEYIDDEYQEMFMDFVNAVGKQNKAVLDRQSESEN